MTKLLAFTAALMSLAVMLGFPSSSATSACGQCPCAPPADLVRAMEEADMVFRGRPASVWLHEAGGMDRANGFFIISEVFKGPHLAAVEVDAPADEPDCGVAFAPWQEYLVFADDVDPDADPFFDGATDRCMGTRLYDGAAAAVLGVPWVPSRPPVPACPRCAPWSWERELEAADLVFAGRLTKVEPLGPVGGWDTLATFRVRRRWKGVTDPVTTVRLTYMNWACTSAEPPYQAGLETMVFATRRPGTDHFIVDSVCGGLAAPDSAPPEDPGFPVAQPLYLPAARQGVRD